MFACLKKPSLLRSAFFILILTTVSAGTKAAQQSTAQCESSPLTIQVKRGELAGTGNNAASQAVAFNAPKTAQVTIGVPIDLNIGADVSANFNGIVTTDVSDWIWRAYSSNRNGNSGQGGFKGNLTAVYQFSGLGINDNKICSSPNSCLVVTNAQSIVTVLERGKNGKIRAAEGRVRLTFDVTQALESGNYTANLAISIYDNGNNGQTLIDCI